MTASSDPRLRDPKWINFRREILREANHECQVCRASDEIRVHISHWEMGKYPWEFQPNAFHVLCQAHTTQRKGLEESIRASLSMFSVSELEPISNAIEFLAHLGAERAWPAEMLYPAAKHLVRMHEKNARRGEEADPSTFEDWP